MKIATGFILLSVPSIALKIEPIKKDHFAQRRKNSVAVGRNPELPAIRRLASDGITFARFGCKEAGRDMPPYRRFLPACMMHLRELVAEVDKSYTDVQLGTVLQHYCWHGKEFPETCDTGFSKEKHCRDFAAELVVARDEELKKGSTNGYKTFCEDYFLLKGGKVQSLKQTFPDLAAKYSGTFSE
jgi:hypothetical protein